VLQDAVSAGGPLLAILGFLLLPLIWSVPEALITAELATTFPENSGYVAWVTAAFGPFWGFQVRERQVSCIHQTPHSARPFTLMPHALARIFGSRRTSHCIELCSTWLSIYPLSGVR